MGMIALILLAVNGLLTLLFPFFVALNNLLSHMFMCVGADETCVII